MATSNKRSKTDEGESSSSKSNVWQYFNVNLSDESKPICKACKATVSRGKSDGKKKDWGTTSMKNHVKSCKGKEEKNIQREQQASIKQMMSRRFPLNKNSPRAKAITNAIGYMVATDLRPYSVVENEGFRNLLKILEPQYSIVSRQELTKVVVPDIFNQVKKKVQKSIDQSASGINFTTDMWKSDKQNREYMAVTGHWIYENEAENVFELKNALLEIAEFHTSAHAYNIRKSLNAVCNNWLSKIDENSSKFRLGISDNAANVTLALNTRRILEAPDETESNQVHFESESDYEEDRDAIDFEEEFPRLIAKHDGSAGCFAHLLNLIVEDALKPNVQRVITDAKAYCERIVTKIRQSRPVAMAFRNAKGDTGKGGLVQNISTRWNSTLLMLRSFVNNKEALNIFLRRTADLDLPPLPRTLGTRNVFWDIVEGLIKVLKIFEEATLHASKEDATLSECIPYSHSLLRSLNKFKSNGNDRVTGLDTFIDTLIDGVTNRLINGNNIHHKIATCLNPRFKLLLIDDIDHDEVRAEILAKTGRISSPSSHQNTDELLEVCNTSNIALAPASEEIEEAGQDSLTATLDNLVKEKMGGTAPLKVADDSAGLTNEQQLAAYLSEPNFAVKHTDDSVLQEILRYWYRRKNEWPTLTKLALSYISCPLSSVSSERVFSMAGNIVTKKRCSLKPGNISRLAFIKFNQKKFK